MEKGNTIGMDLGDKKHQICILDREGEIVKETKLTNTEKSLARFFQNREACVVAMETGTCRTLKSVCSGACPPSSFPTAATRARARANAARRMRSRPP